LWATIPGDFISQSNLFKECGSDLDPINVLGGTINYINYQSHTFSNPCGRLPDAFPNDKFDFFQNVNDNNSLIPIQAYQTTHLGTTYYSDSTAAITADERFVSWMV